MIRVYDLALAFRERVIFKKIDWTIGDRARVGLVGANGAGKTTFLRVLAGEMEPDSGGVEIRGSDCEVGYLPQDLAELGSGTIIEHLRESAGVTEASARLAAIEEKISSLDADHPELDRLLAEHERVQSSFERIGGYEFDATARKVLRGLGFSDGDADRDSGEFSGGWRMRIALAAVLIRRPGILLLDEPTNHLDSESMEWLEGWLTGHTGALIFVSHDRRFLDKMATEIAEVARGEITRYTMGYEQFLVEREAARERREKARLEQKDEIARIERFIERFRYKATKATQVQSRIKKLEKMDVLEDEEIARRVAIHFPEAPRGPRETLSAVGLAKSYGDHTVFRDVDFELLRGERVALVGVNGAGKSTLLRALSGVEAPDAGRVKIGDGVKMAYYSQESAQNLNYAHTIWEEACRVGSPIPEASRRDLLGAFLFSGDDIYKPIRVLSGGERSRLALFKILLSETNFLILDEPTNHLDAITREIYQDALLDYGGTLLIVSHDRAFLDSLATRVVEIRSGAIKNFPGNYSNFIERRAAEAMTEEETARSRAAEARSDKRADRRAEAEERNRLYRARKIFVDRIEELEREIASIEARISEIDASLCDPEIASRAQAIGDLMKERRAAEDRRGELYDEWARQNEEMEAIK